MADQVRGGDRKQLPKTAGAYALGPDDGEALWFNGGLGILKATADETEGRYAIVEFRLPKGFAAPLHIHNNEDEFFLIVDGEIRVQHGDEIVEGVAGSLAYTPKGIAHSFHVDSDEASLLLFFGPAGPEGFFREGGKPAGHFGLPPSDEQFVDRETLIEIMSRHGQAVVGPPLGPKT